MASENSVSIYDVAQEAGVSIATVSRVLNNNGNVSQKTRENVLEALRKLNYQPSAIARAMVNKKMQIVGILTVDIRSENYNVAAYTIERSLAIMGYSSIICNTFGSTEDNINSMQMLLDKGVSGIICIGSVFDKTFNETNILFEYSSVPFIVTNYSIDAENVCSVDFDEQAGIEKVISHLLEGGHSDIFFVKDVESFSSNKKEKVFLGELISRGLEADKGHVVETTRSLEGGEAAVDRIIASGRPFSAILFNDDLTAIGGMKRLISLGYRVPEDVAIVGYNNTVLSKCCTPSLTTVSTNFETLGSTCVDLLMGLIDGTSTAKDVIIKPKLIVRDSS